jgi:hypothetical protein
VQGHRTITVNSGQEDTVHAGWKQTIDPILDQTINGMWKQNVTGNWTQTIAPNWTLGVSTNITWNVGANVDWTVGGQTNINCPVINVIGATFNQTDSSASYWYDFQLKLVGLNLYGNIVVAGANGLKAEANAIKLEADFVELKTVKIKTAAELQQFLTGLLHTEFTILKIFG